MKITDYETGRTLRDIGLMLTNEEAVEMRDYLTRLIENPTITHAYLTEVSDRGLDKEISITIDGTRSGLAPRKLPLPRMKPLSVA